jgi:hypothetical protein
MRGRRVSALRITAAFAMDVRCSELSGLSLGAIVARNDKFDQSSSLLPTNIESATPKYVQNNLASWDAKIRDRRARRLGVSQEEAANLDSKPLFLVELEARAAAEDRPIDLLLDDYANKLRASTYLRSSGD